MKLWWTRIKELEERVRQLEDERMVGIACVGDAGGSFAYYPVREVVRFLVDDGRIVLRPAVVPHLERTKPPA